MQFRCLGRTGLKVSCIGLGTAVTFGNQISDEMAEKIVSTAYANGINYFDTAESYSEGKAQRSLGKILKTNGWRRSSYVVCTTILKGGSSPTESTLSRKRIIEGLLDSLERLRLEYVDIVLIGNDKNRQCSIEEIVRACSFLIDRGWAFYWGTSNWSPQEIMEAHTAARLFHLTPPSLESIEFNMFERDSHEYGIPESCAKLGLGLVTGAPLARGILSGKYINGIPEYSRASLPTQTKLRQHILSKEGQEQQAQVAQISQLAHRLGLSTSQLAIAWCLKSPHVSCVLLGAATEDQLQEDMEAVLAMKSVSNAVLGEIENILMSDRESEGFL